MSYYERPRSPAATPFGHLLSPPPSSIEDEVEVEDDNYDLVSLRSSQCSAYFDYDHDGRLLQNQNDVYLFPADTEEMDRLRAVHKMLYLRNSSLFVGPLAETLEEARVKAYGVPTVLDLGCGGGDWIIDLARQFPFAICLGADLVPTQRCDDYVPENCSFEIMDANLTLPWPENSFDVVNINVGVRDYPGMVARLCAILRPGGLILLAEPELDIHSAAPDHIVPDVLHIYFETLRSALRRRGVDPGEPLQLWPALSNTGLLESAQHDELGIPCSDYMPDSTLHYTGSLNRDCLDQFITSSNSLLLSAGMSRDEVALLQWQVRDALAQDEARFFQRWFHCWGRRPSW